MFGSNRLKLSPLSPSPLPCSDIWRNTDAFSFYQHITQISQNIIALSRKSNKRGPTSPMLQNKKKVARRKPAFQLRRKCRLLRVRRTLPETTPPLRRVPSTSRLLVKSTIWDQVSECGILLSTRCTQMVIFMGNESDLHPFTQSHLKAQPHAQNHIAAPFAPADSLASSRRESSPHLCTQTPPRD